MKLGCDTEMATSKFANNSSSIQKSLKKLKKIQEDDTDTVLNIWIVKPGENTNRGNGINVCCSLKEVNDILSANMYDYHTKTFIVQKYIERP